MSTPAPLSAVGPTGPGSAGPAAAAREASSSACPDRLARVRGALLARAREDAAAELAAADATARTGLEQAAEEAAGIRAAARSQGEADAAGLLAGEVARARRRARAQVLQAQRTAVDQLRARVREDVAALAGTPQMEGLHDALAARARARLGSEATVTPEPDGLGVVATVPGRQVTYSLADLADDAVDRLGPELERLWRP